MEETRDATHSPPHHTARPVPGSVSLADWLHSAFGQTTASVPNIDVIRSDLLWKSKPGDCRLYLKSRPRSTGEGERFSSQWSCICLACPVRHGHPPGPAQRGRCASLLSCLIWEDNKLNGGADDHGGLFAVCTVYI